MDHKNDGTHGRLPAMAPLANPYVPFQLENPPKYEARKGMIRGTLYPGLDLPFMGMVNQKEKPVTPRTELQSVGFAVQELALYLDTHPDDKEALELYQNCQAMLHKGLMEFGEKGKPMNHACPNPSKRYSWMDEPWPWELAANQED